MAAKQKTSNSRFSKLLQPVVDAIKALGGSGRPSEVKEWIIQNTAVPSGYIDSVHKGGESVFGNDVDWARYYLVRAGIIDASKRGVWSLTDLGRSVQIDAAKATDIVRGVDKQSTSSADDDTKPVPEEAGTGFTEQALEIIKALPPAGFERLCQRLLRESGFEEVHVLGRSGDGGIDGQGILKLNSFVSFRVLFQCKRYKESVGPGTVRDFRGAMMGRAEKGLILTTGYFTQQAESEASRDGAQPIELVDGESLVRLLGELELGLRPVAAFEVDKQFFKQFEHD
jgi:restriction system protein